MRGLDLESGGLDFNSATTGRARKLSLPIWRVETDPHCVHGLGTRPSQWFPSGDPAQAMPRPGAQFSVKVGFPLLEAVQVVASGSAWRQADLG